MPVKILQNCAPTGLPEPSPDLPEIKKLHRVNHTAIDMFELVADVEKYPQFLPLCQSLSIRSRQEREGRVMLVADMTVAYKMIKESFASQIHLHRQALAIDVKYLDGPFRYLDNQWRFLQTDDGGCEIDFLLDYQLRSRALQLVMGSVFDLAFGKFTRAFENRADTVYGKKEPPGNAGG